MKIDKSDFMNQHNQLRTSGLFREAASTIEKEKAVYTFNREDVTIKGKTYYSIPRLFMEEIEELGEYDFVIKYFASWEQWSQICKSPRCEPYIKRMREELKAKVRADAIRLLVKKSKKEVNAAKYVAEVGWEKRPTGKKKTKAEKKQDETLMKMVEKDIKNAQINIQ